MVVTRSPMLLSETSDDQVRRVGFTLDAERLSLGTLDVARLRRTFRIGWDRHH